ncbi:MAG: hypothetical protein KatS3mg076_2331 [Candidatus Binatia bacterium]|nr:MAG: hypothetical protein KatS3mg076_2331 [Candidatus Binatia bacterium]
MGSKSRGLLALVFVGLLGPVAVSAQVSVEKSASILIFPKVLYGELPGRAALGSFDTIIQVSNTSNSVVYGHCFYVNAALTDPELPPGPDNPRLWQEVDFDIVLTRQQPTHWVVSEGRTTNPFDPNCGPTNTDCPGAGFDPGRIPPVPPGFEGELKCIEVDQSGAPISGNHLKGEATILSAAGTVNGVESHLVPGDASKYNAIGLLGFDTNDSDTVLCLGGGISADCPSGAEYQGCPEAVLATHFAEEASNPALSDGASSVRTELTIVPCSQNFETQVPAVLRVQFLLFNEFEEPFSTSTTVECWGNFLLRDINPVFSVGSLGSRFVQTRMRPAASDPGFVALLEELHFVPPPPAVSLVSRAAANLTVVGERTRGDLVVVPGGP